MRVAVVIAAVAVVVVVVVVLVRGARGVVRVRMRCIAMCVSVVIVTVLPVRVTVLLVSMPMVTGFIVVPMTENVQASNVERQADARDDHDLGAAVFECLDGFLCLTGNHVAESVQAFQHER